MLPNILDIAEENGLIFNTRSLNKKEVFCKCPFCLEDASKADKHYLSLNTSDNVYRCWFCGDKGGVLQFEAKLTGLSYEMIKEKRLGKLRKPLHAAERLSPHQLSSIGWREVKQNDKSAFQKSREQVLKDWQEYEFTEMVSLYAEFKAISQLPDANRQRELCINLKANCDKTKITDCYKRLIGEYKKVDSQKADWAVEGEKIFQMTWLACTLEGDADFQRLILYVPFFHFMWKSERQAKKLSSK